MCCKAQGGKYAKLLSKSRKTKSQKISKKSRKVEKYTFWLFILWLFDSCGMPFTPNMRSSLFQLRKQLSIQRSFCLHDRPLDYIFLHSSGQNSRLTINTVRDSSWLVDDWASPSYRPLPNRLPCHCLISKIWYWLTSYHPQIPMPKVPLKVATQFTQYLDFSSIACQNHSSHSDGLPLENPEPCLHLTVVPQFHEHAIWYRMPLTCRPCGLMSTTHLPPEINQKEAAYECTPHGTLLLLCKLMLKQDSSKTYQFQSQEPPARCHLSALLLKLSSAMVVPCIPQAGLYAARVDKQGAGLEIVSISQRTSSFFWDVLAWRKIVKSRRTPEWLACMLHRSQPDIMDVAAKP